MGPSATEPATTPICAFSCSIAEGDDFLRMRQQRQRFGIVGIDHRNAAARQIVAEQLAQFLHALVVEADVEQHADSRTIERDRTVAFVDFADIEALPADDRAGIGPFGGDEILHHRAVHDRRLASAGVEDPAEHAGDGRLSAGPGNRQPGAAGVEQDRIELGAGQPQAFEFLGALGIGYGVFYGGAGDEDLFGRDDAAAVLRMQRETLLFERGELVGRAALIVAAVRTLDRAAAAFQDLRQRQHSRSADAAEEEGRANNSSGVGISLMARAAIELCRAIQAR